MSDRKPYKSDLSDERWALIDPVIAAWKADHPSPTGHQGRYEIREIVNAILYQGRTGCQWDYLPHDLPPKSAVYYYSAAWRDDGTDVKMNDLLRWQVREKAGRSEDPSLVVIDTQSVRAAVNVPAATTGKDAAKKVPGRKRGVAIDVLGLVIAVTVLVASAHDNAFGIDVEIVERNPADKDAGFVPQAKRWIVEQTLGILMLFRRLVRDYESRPKSSESRVRWAMIDVMARRLTAWMTRSHHSSSGSRHASGSSLPPRNNSARRSTSTPRACVNSTRRWRTWR